RCIWRSRCAGGPAGSGDLETVWAWLGHVDENRNVSAQDRRHLCDKNICRRFCSFQRFTVRLAERVTPPELAEILAVPLLALEAAVAEKFADVAPAGTVTAAGTITFELLLERVTATPPVGAAPDNVTVQVDAGPGAIAIGLQASAESTGGVGPGVVGAVWGSGNVFWTPLQLAVILTVVEELTCDAVAAKPAVVEPVVTVTNLGMLRLGLFSESATEIPPAGAGELRVTVQVEVPGVKMAPGLQVKSLRTGATTVSGALAAVPAALADSVTAVSAATAEVVDANPALVAPAATVTEAGTLTAALPLESDTGSPPVGAALFKVTVQALDVPPGTLAGLQASEETPGGAT